MNRSILALSILAVGFVCVPAFAQDIVPTRPSDGMPDFYYFDVEAAMPGGAIYAGEVFPAGTFIIDPDGPTFGLATMVVEGPPALGFDDNPDPGKNTAPRHTNAGSIITAIGWNAGTERYSDTLIAMVPMDFGAGRDWAVAYMPGNPGTMQLGMTSGPGLMTKQKDGEPFEYKSILTKGLVYEGGLGPQFGIVTFANSSGMELRTPITVIPEPNTLTLLAVSTLFLAIHVCHRRRRCE